MKTLYKLRILYNYIIAKYELKVLNESNLREFQERKIRKHLNYIIKKSKYYKKNIGSKSYELSDFPIVNKSIMMDNFDELCTGSIKKEEGFKIALNSERSRDFSKDYKKYSVALSSGTSGNRGLVVVDDYEKSLWTGRMLAKLLPKNLVTKEKIAFFLRANNNVYESLNSNNIKFKYFDLLNPVEINMKDLEIYNPDILTAPPSMLLIIADILKEKKIKIAPKLVISVAEVLEESDRKKLEEIFKQKVHEIYQATEGFLGHSCKYGTMHINEDMIFIEKEYIDKESGRFIPIITDFRRRVQPIVRYRLNDILVEKKEKCQCGSPFMALEKIEGREDDTFIFSSPTGNITLFSDFISRAVIYSSDNIKSYYVSQREINDVNIYVEMKNHEELDKVKKEIERNFNDLKLKLKIPEMNISFTDEYVIEPGRKTKRVERLF